MVMIVFIHGYNLRERYLQPWTMPNERLTPTSFTEYFFANGIFRFLIPMLFAISGYLYAMRDEQVYGQRIKKRLRVLLIPYLVWSAAGLAFVYGLEMFPLTRSLVENSHLVQVSKTRLLVHDYYWYELLVRWILIPVAYQLWFVRVLIVYNLAYPALRWCVMHKTVRWLFFGVAVLLWVGTFGTLLVEGEGLLFFSLGIWLQKTNYDLQERPRWLHPLLWGITFLLLCAGKTWLAFKGKILFGYEPTLLLALLHKLAIGWGLIAAWYGSNRIADWCMGRRWFVWLSAFSFIIYAMHAPAVAIAIDGVFGLLHYGYGYRIVTYLLLPTAMIVACVGFGALLRWVAPKLYGVVTGGRGF